MLVLHNTSEVLSTLNAGGWVVLPNGDRLSPATAGWKSEDGVYKISELVETPQPVYDTNAEKLQLSDEILDGVPTRVWMVEALPPIPLETVKTNRRDFINSERDAVIAAGFEYKVGEVSYGVFDSDSKSIAMITGAVTNALAGFPLPEGFSWRNASNEDIPMSIDLLKGLGATAAAHVHIQHTIARQLKQSIDDAATEEEVRAVVWP